MRVSQLLIATLREAPSDAEVISHQLMLRAGLIRKVAAGIYTWLPLGLRVLRKVEQIVREEMDRAGAQEVLMPGVLPGELWQESGRWDQYGPELLRLKDRHQRDFCLGPTHEEVITDLVRNEIRSYKQLPANFYQIQTKFRDEIRPRFGIMRGREFLMKDAYSFHTSEASLAETYQLMHETYARIFTRLGLDFRAVAADSGNIGGNRSHEFHVLASSGEDDIVFSTGGDYAANIEKAEALPPAAGRPGASETLQTLPTPNVKSIADLATQHGIAAERCAKTLIVAAEEDHEAEFFALLVRGDHELNEVKASKLDGIAEPLRLATEAEVSRVMPASIGSLGPIDCPLPLVVDHSVAALADFCAGANVDGQHYTGINWGRDLPEPERVCDLRKVQAGDPSPAGDGSLQILRGIEVGHIFQLGSKYSEALKATCLDEQGKSVTLQMGCYGIGVSRIVAAAIEQNHDERGILWPAAIAPFSVALIPINMHKSERLKAQAESLYQAMLHAGIEVLMDDRRERPGVMFNDVELIGIPHRLVLSDRGLDAGTAEYKGRADSDNSEISLADAVDFLKQRLQAP